jgi:hypothetical protein
MGYFRVKSGLWSYFALQNICPAGAPIKQQQNNHPTLPNSSIKRQLNIAIMAAIITLKDVRQGAIFATWDALKLALNNWAIRDKFTYRTPRKTPRGCHLYLQRSPRMSLEGTSIPAAGGSDIGNRNSWDTHVFRGPVKTRGSQPYRLVNRSYSAAAFSTIIN